MKHSLKTSILLLILVFFIPSFTFKVISQEFIHTQGQNFIDGKGNKVYFRSVGLGNWMLPEGYMWHFGKNGDRPRRIEKIVTDLIGQDQAIKFWQEYRKNYISEADIKKIAEVGFNCVRPALNSRLFVTEGENPVFIDAGFQLLDSLVKWCTRYHVYIIIDMHGAPGGQTGQNIDDSQNDQPELFMDVKNRDLLVELWVKIAQRYKDEPCVAAYDLLNEPLPKRTGAEDMYKLLLEPLYKRITAAIRQVDNNHMISLEGADWANDWSAFSEPFDHNMFYQFHYYCWNRPDNLNDVSYFISKRKEFNTPIWAGETGEKGNTIYWATTQYFEANNIGWSFWLWKKMDTQNTPCSIVKPDGWDSISGYVNGGPKPSREMAEKEFNQLLENIKLENCVYFPDVVNAIFRRVPGIVEAENYGTKGYNNSYFVNDTSLRSENYRKTEPVPVRIIETQGLKRTSEQYIILNTGEWTNYDINSLTPQVLTGTIRVKGEEMPATIEVSINGSANQYEITSADWTELPLGNCQFHKGQDAVKISVKQGKVDIDRMNFE